MHGPDLEWLLAVVPCRAGTRSGHATLVLTGRRGHATLLASHRERHASELVALMGGKGVR